jgi:hypothetical protein
LAKNDAVPEDFHNIKNKKFRDKKTIPKKAVFLPNKTVLIFCLLFVCLPSKIMHEKNGGDRASFPTTRGDWLL